jgi:hypothetical protein
MGSGIEEWFYVVVRACSESGVDAGVVVIDRETRFYCREAKLRAIFSRARSTFRLDSSDFSTSSFEQTPTPTSTVVRLLSSILPTFFRLSWHYGVGKAVV